MTKVQFTFNGSVYVDFIPDNEEDKQLLALAFNGRVVTTMTESPNTGGGIRIKLEKPETRKPESKS